MKILIIDDEVELCEALAMYLEELEIKDLVLEMSFEGNDALDKIKKNHYDMIICDINLPNINGLDLSVMARKLDINIKIVLISGIENIMKSISTVGLGIHNFLRKPIDTVKLSELVKTAVEEKFLIQQGGNCENFNY